MTITLMTATVEVEPGWAVGSVAAAGSAIDRDILLDAAGRPWIPGSSIAGSLRAHLAAADPPADAELMGSRPPASRAESAESRVSPLWIVGAVLAPDRTAASADDDLETIGQTAISRSRGAAAAGPLRVSRMAATGGRLTVYLRHDPDLRHGPLTEAHLALIARWRPAIGRDRTTGAGRARLVELRHGTVDPGTPDGAATWLSHDGHELFDAVATQRIAGPAEDAPWLTASFDITDGLLIGSSLAEKAATSRKRNGRPLVPGSAWKGVIRSRAEYIIRSVHGEDAACQQKDGTCQQQGGGPCPACAVFGHQGQRGLLAFRDSYIEDAVEADPARTHVGIDRVTGGSREALLFQTAPLTSGQLRLCIDALDDPPPWTRNLIGHVLRDIGDGLIGVGSRTTRGLGTLRLTSPPDDLEPVVICQPADPAPAEPAP
jgi:CRISPR/Cas system CSM-associated protein Csm3 (group 7 of RAMP superfamily)